ncbi:hypothetical protein [Paralcaligenes ureilyticus]|nr:hypothetical protein [Paralcaligenes ureilyticus]
MMKNGLGLSIGALLFLCTQAAVAGQDGVTSGAFQVRVNILAQCDLSPTALESVKNVCRNEVLHQVVATPIESSSAHAAATRDQKAQVYRVTVVY